MRAWLATRLRRVADWLEPDEFRQFTDDVLTGRYDEVSETWAEDEDGNLYHFSSKRKVGEPR